MSKPQVAILGAGPAGLGAAFQLARRGLTQVTVLERNAEVGGAAGSFVVAGIHADYGSHRLHPACDPEVLSDIRALLGGDLLDRPRHGRIRLRGRWIHFPLKPIDLALRLPPGFMLGVAADPVRRLWLRRPAGDPDSFASVLQAGLGQTICREFYFPYARKIWGRGPEELSAAQARRRVSANSLSKMLGRVLMAAPGLKPKKSGRFFYPRQGYGQISEAFAQAARQAGAAIHLEARVHSVESGADGLTTVHYEHKGQLNSLAANLVWSTIPITALARCIRPAPPAEYLRSAERLEFRPLLLIYLVLEQDRFSEYDAHYFPEAQVPITRLSEPKNYSQSREPGDCTVLCAELPCALDSPEWAQDDGTLGELVCRSLATAGIPVRARVRQVVTRRLPQAYPIYRQGYETSFNPLDEWLDGQEGLLTFGRQGLFAHDNTHHALFMAYAAAKCLDAEGRFDRRRWHEFRAVFETHVVED